MDGKVVQGTAGWSDASIVSCRKFYPPGVKNTVEKLHYYSRQGTFGCVEVDVSCYAIPLPENVAKWVAATPDAFVFHFKAFGLFTNLRIDAAHLPRDIKNDIGKSEGNVELSTLTSAQQSNLWAIFHKSIHVAHDSQKLGVIIFQFFFAPGGTSKAHIEYCAKNLQPWCKMAIEFRDRRWFCEENISDTLSFLKSVRPEGVALIASDDLAREMKAEWSLQSQQHMPTYLTSKCCPNFAYIRVHRRQGIERVLSDKEIASWVYRICKMVHGNDKAHDVNDCNLVETCPEDILKGKTVDEYLRGKVVESNESETSDENTTLQGPIYVLWGTDHEHQPVLNAQKLRQALPESLRLEWKDFVKDKQPTIANMFTKMQQPAKKDLSRTHAGQKSQPLAAGATDPKRSMTCPQHDSSRRNDSSDSLSLKRPREEAAVKSSLPISAPSSSSPATTYTPRDKIASAQTPLAMNSPAAKKQAKIPVGTQSLHNYFKVAR
jgi:uncharacterized protein YecE (DUF72 family)